MSKVLSPADEILRFKEKLLLLPEAERHAFVASLTEQEQAALFYNWKFWARPEQLAPPGDWHVWVCLAGRGWGKTRTGAEWTIEQAKTPGTRIALIAKTPKDSRQVMIEGESGILACSPPDFMPEYNKSLGTLLWPNGSLAESFTSEVPDQLRGPQFHRAWIDEWAKFRFPVEVWDMLMFALRLGRNPRAMITTTPRPLPILRQVLKDPKTRISSGSTFDNADNLPENFLHAVRSKYEGTTLGQQELYAAILDDTEGALWNRELIESLRVKDLPRDENGKLLIYKVVLGADPAVTTTEDSDETGLVAVGLGPDKHAYVMHDRSGLGAFHLHVPTIVKMWATGDLDLVVGEVNNGGDLIEHALRTARDADDRPVGLSIPYKSVRATKGKAKRAEPVAMLYQQKRVHHWGVFAELEDQMCTWVPDLDAFSPDRMDALVWALHELLVQPDPEIRIRNFGVH